MGGGQGKCERRSEVIVKIQKHGGTGWGRVWGSGWIFFFWGGGGGVGSRGQGRCEQRSEVFVKIQKTNGGGGQVGERGVRGSG